MKHTKQLVLFKNRNRSIYYTGKPVLLNAVMPQKFSYDAPVFAGRFVVLHIGKALHANKYPFVSYIVSTSGAYYPLEDPTVEFPIEIVKYASALIHDGDDYRYFYRLGSINNFVRIMMLEPGEIFGIPYTEEYFEEELAVGDPVAINGHYYRRGNEGEGIIGYVVGFGKTATPEIFIRFEPEILRAQDNVSPDSEN